MAQSSPWKTVLSLVALFWLAACGATQPANVAAPATATQPAPDEPTIVVPTPTPTATQAPVLAAATAQPTVVPPSPTPQVAPTVAATGAQSVTIQAADGSPIFGEVLGSGTTAVIFSVMGSCKPGWTHLAQEVADRGYAVLTYRWRACHGNRVDERQIRMFVDDTRAAIQYMRDRGAQHIVLIGASLGGCASAKLLAESQADGLVVIASPSEIPDWGFRVAADDLKSIAPKLFITSEEDATVPAAATRALYNLASAPREWQTYSGSAHGTDIFEGDQGAALSERILAFLEAIEPPK